MNGGDQKLIKFWLDLLVQKFEVTKKIYHHYPINFGKGLGPNDSLESLLDVTIIPVIVFFFDKEYKIFEYYVKNI